MTHLGKTMAIASRYLVVREAPKSSSAKIGSVDAGVELPVTGASVDGWYPVKFNDADGYIYGRYVSISNVEPVAEEDETSSTPEETAENAIQETSSDDDCPPVIASSEARPEDAKTLDVYGNRTEVPTYNESYPASGEDVTSSDKIHFNDDGSAVIKKDTPASEVIDFLAGHRADEDGHASTSTTYNEKESILDIPEKSDESSDVDEHKEHISATVENIHNRVNDQEVKHLEREEKKSIKKKKGLFRAILDFFGW